MFLHQHLERKVLKGPIQASKMGWEVLAGLPDTVQAVPMELQMTPLWGSELKYRGLTWKAQRPGVEAMSVV